MKIPEEIKKELLHELTIERCINERNKYWDTLRSQRISTDPYISDAKLFNVRLSEILIQPIDGMKFLVTQKIGL